MKKPLNHLLVLDALFISMLLICFIAIATVITMNANTDRDIMTIECGDTPNCDQLQVIRDGDIIIETPYRNNVMHGEQIWYQNDSVIATVKYRNGKYTKVIVFNKSDSLVTKVQTSLK